MLGFHITYENHKIVIILRTTTNLPCHRREPRSGSSSGRSGRLKELDSVRASHVHMDIKASGGASGSTTRIVKDLKQLQHKSRRF